MKTLSLIIPCFNEEKTIESCVSRCLVLSKHGVDVELVIVDDCSTDRSFEKARQLREKYPDIITLERHAVNQGKGAALRTGFSRASGQFVGIQDADAEYDPLDYIKLLKPLQEGKADVVYGSRYLRRDTRRVLYFWHTWMNRALTFVSNMFTNLDISDMETCYKLFRNDVIKIIATRLQEKRFGFEPEVTALVAQEKLRVYECAIHYSPRTYEEGKKIGWRDGVHALYCILHYSAHCAPLPMQILLYSFIGASAAVANILCFSGLFAFGMSLFSAVGISFLFAAMVNYLLCIAILFQHKARWSCKGEILAYVVTLLVMGAVDYTITSGLMALGMSAHWSKILSTVVGFAGNFALRKFFVF